MDYNINITKLYELMHAADELLKEKLEALLPASTKITYADRNKLINSLSVP